MSNHVHLVVTPRKNDSLALALKNTHGRYAAYWNATHSSSGHVWQGRYYSCPLDLPHMWSALRYTELNPIRAGIVSDPDTYRWSSAAAHCGTAQPDLPLEMDLWRQQWNCATWKNIYAIQTRELISKRFGSVRIQGAPWERRSSLPLWRTVPVACLRRRKLVVRRGWLRIVINHYSTSIRKRPVCPRISVRSPKFRPHSSSGHVLSPNFLSPLPLLRTRFLLTCAPSSQSEKRRNRSSSKAGPCTPLGLTNCSTLSRPSS